jgi:predicted TIM-barrel fold metal-dependent hydrolase
MRIDAHLHYTADHPEAIAMLERLDLKLLNICVAHEAGSGWRAQAETYIAMARLAPERLFWCTSFDLPTFEEADYADRVIAQIDADVAAGAVACKVWKNIGMEVRKPDGAFLMIDDPLFDPIFEHLRRIELPLLMHIGEPLACWRPLVDDNPHYGYYRRNPQWHMYDKPAYPSHERIIAARDRMIERNPKLRIIGAHFGSLEYDVAEIARRLDRFPNFAVDSSARLHDLTYQDRETVRRFFLDYPDRVLFGTDLVHREPVSRMSDAERAEHLERIAERYASDFRYYESDAAMTLRGREVRGLGLPDAVLRRFCHDNAVAWYPGLA